GSSGRDRYTFIGTSTAPPPSGALSSSVTASSVSTRPSRIGVTCTQHFIEWRIINHSGPQLASRPNPTASGRGWIRPTIALPSSVRSVPTRSRRPPSSPDTLQSSSITLPQDQGRSRRRAPAGTVRPPGRRRTRSAGSRRGQRYGGGTGDLAEVRDTERGHRMADLDLIVLAAVSAVLHDLGTLHWVGQGRDQRECGIALRHVAVEDLRHPAIRRRLCVLPSDLVGGGQRDRRLELRDRRGVGPCPAAHRFTVRAPVLAIDEADHVGVELLAPLVVRILEVLIVAHVIV